MSAIKGPSASFLVGRAVLALALLIGFYVIAVGISGALFWIPYAEFVYLERVDPRIAAVCIGAGGAILWSLRPRFDKFEPPGPRVDAADQPRLFAMIDEVAALTRQAPPADVYIVPDVNAFVTQRGGLLGFGSRRVMGLGLPLLAVLDVNELRAVLAHEFGHYHGGDVALGPLVHRTRSAIGQTLRATGGTFVEQPFIAYAGLFLRVSSAVSRHQEFIADGVAAGAVGQTPLATGLRKAHDSGLAFQMYMGLEVLPVLRCGFLPPISSGFADYMSSPFLRERLPAEAHAEASDHDSHPSLEDRLAAIGVGDLLASEPAAPALSLLDRRDELEFQAFPFRQDESPLKPIAWADTTEQALLPEWRQFVATHREMLNAIPVDQLPTSIKAAARFSAPLKSRDEGYVKLDALAARVASLIGMAVAVMLHDRGWRADSKPGMPTAFAKGEARFEPFEEVTAVVFGKKSLADWSALCVRYGLSGTLGTAARLGSGGSELASHA